MKRRDFINTTALSVLGLSLPLNSILTACKGKGVDTSPYFKQLSFNLLKTWCDGMLAVQIIDPAQPELHGALGCPSCNKIHGRCMDAVYPFFYMAHVTGEQKYLDAGIAVFEWSKNVTESDGSWTVIPDPKSWKGITVFGAIALGETLHYHGDLLDEQRKIKWTDRLSKAGDYIYKNFDLTFTNVNYGFSAVYALNLLGRVLKNDIYIERSRELAKGVKDFFTSPNNLLFGEGKPSDKLSPKGLLPVDLGYNVEESLNNVVMYALHEKDEELLELLTKSLESHLEFMLPDGAWDNSWGTRQAKWSYWGSRTTDGCQTGYGLMAEKNSAFGTAMIRNTELLQRCTSDGLLHGGPHFVSHGILPCVHHTFAHAKPLAAILDMGKNLPVINDDTPLPRLTSDGVKVFPEVDIWLLARGPWKGTISSYDFVYKEHAQQATGGALSVLYHEKVGLLLTASMAKYMLVELNNQQENPEEDFALTPRIETTKDSIWYTNLYDLDAKVKYEDKSDVITFDIHTQLQDEDRRIVDNAASNFDLVYIISKEKVEIKAKSSKGNILQFPTSLVVPIVSTLSEEVKQISPNRIEVYKENGTVVIESNTKIHIKETAKGRVFNMVPGVEAIPLIMNFEEEVLTEIICSIAVFS